MSLSSDVRNIAKPHGMRDFSEHHPMLLALAVLAGIVATLMVVSQYVFI